MTDDPQGKVGEILRTNLPVTPTPSLALPREWGSSCLVLDLPPRPPLRSTLPSPGRCPPPENFKEVPGPWDLGVLTVPSKRPLTVGETPESRGTDPGILKTLDGRGCRRWRDGDVTGAVKGRDGPGVGRRGQQPCGRGPGTRGPRWTSTGLGGSGGKHLPRRTLRAEAGRLGGPVVRSRLAPGLGTFYPRVSSRERTTFSTETFVLGGVWVKDRAVLPLPLPSSSSPTRPDSPLLRSPSLRGESSGGVSGWPLSREADHCSATGLVTSGSGRQVEGV